MARTGIEAGSGLEDFQRIESNIALNDLLRFLDLKVFFRHVERGPGIVTRWRGRSFARLFVDIYLGDEIGRNRCRDEQKSHDQQFVH